VGVRSFLISVTALLIALLVLGIWFYPANSDFRADNPLWNGARTITADYDIRPLAALSGLPALPSGASLIVIPYIDFTPGELDELGRFVRQGGRLILADDYGYGNRVLEYLGTGARFTGDVLLDPLLNYRSRQLPKISSLEADALTANVSTLVFNHATCLAGGSGEEVLAFSSSFSFLDLNGDGTHEDNETAGPLPVISRQRLGDGQLLLISDPSIFINSMAGLADNAALIHNLAAGSEALYLDQSHLDQSELYRSKSWLHGARYLAATPAGTGGLVIIVLVAALAPVWRRRQIQKDISGDLE
jgi:hypothetical protein